MVTGPVSKEIIASSGAPHAARFLGHTEHLQRRLRAREVVMAFWNERFTTALVTTHLPLAKVPRAITPDAVGRAVYWLARLLLALRTRPARPAHRRLRAQPARRGRGAPRPRRGARDRARHRARAARAWRARGVMVEGPLGAETAFRRARSTARLYAGVVAMYHDQATIPMKLLGFGEAVNVSLGLPIIRTSVDHGTGYDIAGAASLTRAECAEAIALAVRLALIAKSKRGRT